MFKDAYRHDDVDAALGVPDFMSETMIRNRWGVIHLFANMEYEDRAKLVAFAGLDLAAIGITASGELRRMNTDFVLFGAEHGAQVLRDARDGVAKHLLGEVKDILQGIDGQSRGRAVRSAQDPSAEIEAIYTPVLTDICGRLAGHFVAAAVPFVGSGLGIVDSTKNAIKAGVRRYKLARLGRHVDVLDGMPACTVKGILNGMNRRLAADAYDVLKNVGSLAMEAATVGIAAPMIKLAMAVAEVVVNTLWRLYDITRMQHFSAQARGFLAQGDWDRAIHRRPMAFNAWYADVALSVPAVAAITLRSGMCGDKMHLLRMFGTSDERVSQAQFDAGVAYLDKVRTEGVRYLKAMGYGFRSRDRVVDRHLSRALRWDAGDETPAFRAARP